MDAHVGHERWLTRVDEENQVSIYDGRGFVAAVPDFCAPCALRETCQGGCKAAAQVCYGTLTTEDPFLHLNRDQARERIPLLS